jgi:hypothetical protein
MNDFEGACAHIQQLQGAEFRQKTGKTFARIASALSQCNLIRIGVADPGRPDATAFAELESFQPPAGARPRRTLARK